MKKKLFLLTFLLSSATLTTEGFAGNHPSWGGGMAEKVSENKKTSTSSIIVRELTTDEHLVAWAKAVIIAHLKEPLSEEFGLDITSNNAVQSIIFSLFAKYSSLQRLHNPNYEENPIEDLRVLTNALRETQNFFSFFVNDDDDDNNQSTECFSQIAENLDFLFDKYFNEIILTDTFRGIEINFTTFTGSLKIIKNYVTSKITTDESLETICKYFALFYPLYLKAQKKDSSLNFSNFCNAIPQKVICYFAEYNNLDNLVDIFLQLEESSLNWYGFIYKLSFTFSTCCDNFVDKEKETIASTMIKDILEQKPSKTSEYENLLSLISLYYKKDIEAFKNLPLLECKERLTYIHQNLQYKHQYYKAQKEKYWVETYTFDTFLDHLKIISQIPGFNDKCKTVDDISRIFLALMHEFHCAYTFPYILDYSNSPMYSSKKFNFNDFIRHISIIIERKDKIKELAGIEKLPSILSDSLNGRREFHKLFSMLINEYTCPTKCICVDESGIYDKEKTEKLKNRTLTFEEFLRYAVKKSN